MDKCTPGLDKARIARSFRRSMASYDQEAVIQRRANQRLLTQLRVLNRNDYRRILEIGCGTGMLTQLLCSCFQPSTYFLNDLVPALSASVMARLDERARKCIQPAFGDIESQTMPTDLDLVVSSSTFQWLNDLDACFEKINQALRERGVVAFSMFGEDTLHEPSVLTGVGLTYLSFQKVRDLLADKFLIRHADVVREHLCFEHPGDVLKHIQATGVGGVGGHVWTPRRLQAFNEAYLRRFGNGHGVVLTYVSYLFIAGKKGQ